MTEQQIREAIINFMNQEPEGEGDYSCNQHEIDAYMCEHLQDRLVKHLLAVQSSALVAASVVTCEWCARGIPKNGEYLHDMTPALPNDQTHYYKKCANAPKSEQRSPRVCVTVCPTCKRNLVGIKAEDCECGQGYTNTYI